MFVGRRRELDLFADRLERIRVTGEGQSVAIRGRRQVGKSRLVQEFCDRSEVPYCFYEAVKGMSPTDAIGDLLQALRESSLAVGRAGDTLPSVAPANWGDMFKLLAQVLPDSPSVVVLDEMPWLSEQETTFDGHLQVAWDRLLSRKPVLLLLLGSDLHMMQRFTEYDRPFYGRADNLVLHALNPAETARQTGLTGADAIDAHLITGGLPGIVRRWGSGMPAADFLERQLTDQTSPLFSVPEAALAAEFPLADMSSRVFEAIGGQGGRTFTNIARDAGAQGNPVSSGTLSPVLSRLADDKQIVAVDRPLSTRPSKLAVYRIADTNLSLYVAMLREVHHLVRRDREAAARTIIARRWSTWRGLAVEPLVREALARAGGDGGLPWDDVLEVGGWWNRQANPEIDLVGADRMPVASRVPFAGSIKWQDGAFDRHHLAGLVRDAPLIPGFEPGVGGLVVVSRSGVDLPDDAVDLVWGPDDVLGAWTA
ncbi:ATP-binding protein [Actinoplanes sp. NBRC 101535]|uniref:ATP-binding protein n=1 Tax=Actinoplanes sp. NBRC 101535 TaxID=3032196 RepID=UPI0024A21D67|nr:ATP-binding protein [Actinoplanes sp. NBRC 101535]GLY06840.1 ATPase [Actinoplanes sp. NBRC 101535]